MKCNEIVKIFVIVILVFMLFRKAAYSIIVPNEHKIGTTDDAIHLVGSSPVSPLLTESITYEFLDTLARHKGTDGVDDLLMVDFQGMSVGEVSELLQSMNVDELIEFLKSKGYPNAQRDAFATELFLNESLGNIRDEGTGIDCTQCKWKQFTTTTPDGNVVNSGIKQCVYEGDGYEVDCNPGICNPIKGKDPWPNVDPWEPSAELKTSWACDNGNVASSEGRCLAYSNDDPTKCIEFERTYADYTPVLNN